ncbi:hypothetical protein Hanom_Chr07g00634611 [Helianthus anomalus]
MFPSTVTNPTSYSKIPSIVVPTNLDTYPGYSGYFPAISAPVQQVNPIQSTPTPAQTRATTSATSATSDWSSPITVSKDFVEHMVFMAGVMNSYHAFITGKLAANQIAPNELHEVHPDNIEEMKITWQMAMAVFRAKNFVKRSGRNKWESACQ